MVLSQLNFVFLQRFWPIKNYWSLYRIWWCPYVHWENKNSENGALWVTSNLLDCCLAAFPRHLRSSKYTSLASSLSSLTKIFFPEQKRRWFVVLSTFTVFLSIVRGFWRESSSSSPGYFLFQRFSRRALTGNAAFSSSLQSFLSFQFSSATLPELNIRNPLSTNANKCSLMPLTLYNSEKQTLSMWKCENRP